MSTVFALHAQFIFTLDTNFTLKAPLKYENNFHTKQTHPRLYLDFTFIRKKRSTSPKTSQKRNSLEHAKRQNRTTITRKEH